MSLATSLRAARESRQRTLHDLAKLTGITLDNLTKTEAGQPASWHTVQLLALALEVSTDDLRDEELQLPMVKTNRLNTVKLRGTPVSTEAVGTMGATLRLTRERQNRSQLDVARSAGLTPQAVSVLEQGINTGLWDTIQRLALALGITTEELRDPELRLPEPVPAKTLGRPRKPVDENAVVLPKRPRGRPRKVKE